jgi:hypothetical protein
VVEVLALPYQDCHEPGRPWYVDPGARSLAWTTSDPQPKGDIMTYLAWHFVAGDKLRDGTPVEAGHVYRLPNGQKPVLCRRGYHASRRPLDVLRYAPGPTVCRVELMGTVIEDTDKAVATQRKVLWIADATMALRRFAVWCARRALRTREAAGSNVDQSWAALEVAERWLAGRATSSELDDAARTATRAAGVYSPDVAIYSVNVAAGHAAAFYGTRSAANDADADAAALYAAAHAANGADSVNADAAYGAHIAAHGAANAIAYGAAYGAAKAIDNAIAHYAAYVKAHTAERSAQNRRLARVLTSLAPEQL